MSRKVLIAEDEPNIVASLEFLLARLNCEVCVARDGEEALRQVESFAPHLVLLDVMMPRKNGFEVCRRIRENPALQRVKIVMLSARGRDEEREKGRALGADAYITKPFSTKELLAKVDALLPGEAMSPAVPSTAYIVDDDEAMRTLWRWLMESNAIPVQTFATAAGFIAAYRREDPGCLILDLNLPGMSGLELQDYLKREGIEIPIVFVTGHADVPTAVSALKGGAVDFIQKPFGYREVVAVIRKAFARDAEIREASVHQALIASRIAALTDRERDVLRRIIEGKQNKIIAAELEISIKTVEVHRAKVMEKMRAESVAELVQCMLGFSLMEAARPGG